MPKIKGYDATTSSNTTNGEAFEVEDIEPLTLIERLRTERSRIIKDHNAKIREFNRIEKLLVETEAENVIKEATDLLFS